MVRRGVQRRSNSTKNEANVERHGADNSLIDRGPDPSNKDKQMIVAQKHGECKCRPGGQMDCFSEPEPGSPGETERDWRWRTQESRVGPSD